MRNPLTADATAAAAAIATELDRPSRHPPSAALGKLVDRDTSSVEINSPVTRKLI